LAWMSIISSVIGGKAGKVDIRARRELVTPVLHPPGRLVS
jgi:hypothetical protein